MVFSTLLEAARPYIWIPILVAVIVAYFVSMLFFSKTESVPDSFVKTSQTTHKLAPKSKKEKQQAKKKAKKALKAKESGATKDTSEGADETESVSTGFGSTDAELTDSSPTPTVQKPKKKRTAKEVEYKEDVVIIVSHGENTEDAAEGEGASNKKKKHKKKKSSSSGQSKPEDELHGDPNSLLVQNISKKTSILKNAYEHSPVAPEPQKFPHVKVPKDEIELAKMKHPGDALATPDDVHSTSSKESKSMKKRNKKKLRAEDVEVPLPVATHVQHEVHHAQPATTKATAPTTAHHEQHPHDSAVVRAAVEHLPNGVHLSAETDKSHEGSTDSGISLSTQLHRKNEEISTLTKEVNRLKRTLETRENELAHQRESLRELNHLRAEYEPLKETQAKYSNMEKAQRIMQEQFSTKVQQVTSLEEEIKRLKKRMETSEVGQKMIVAEREQFLHSIREKEHENQMLRGDCEKTQELCRQRDALLNEKDIELKKVQGEYSRLWNELQQEKFRAEESLKGIATSVETLRAQLKEKCELETSLREELNHREMQQRHALEVKEKEFREHLGQLKENDSSVQQRYDALEVNCKELAAARDDLERQLTEARAHSTASSQELANKEQEIGHLKEHQAHLQDEVNKLHSQLAEREAQSHSLGEDRSNLENEIRDLQHKLQESEARCNHLQETHSQLTQDTNSQLHTVREELQETHRKLAEEQQRAHNSHHEKEEALRRVHELQGHSEELSRRKEEKEAECASLREQLREREASEATCKHERDELQKKVNEISEEKEKSQTHYQELLRGTEDVLHKLQSSIQEEETKWRANLAASEQECVQLKEMVAQLESTGGQNEKRVQELNDSLTHLQAELHTANEAKNTISAEMEAVRQRLTGELEASRASVEQLQRELQELRERQKADVQPHSADNGDNVNTNNSAEHQNNHHHHDNSSTSLNESQVAQE